MKLVQTFKEDEKIFKERFVNFNMPIKLTKKTDMVADHPWADIRFHCQNIQEYLDKSRNIKKIIEEEFSYKHKRKTKFACSTLRFILDNLTIDDIKDSYFDYMRQKGVIGPSSYPIAVRRRDFILSDFSRKILSYINLHRDSPDDKTWSATMYSEKGDYIGIIASSLQNKEDEKDINVCELHKIRNYSLEKHLATSS